MAYCWHTVLTLRPLLVRVTAPLARLGHTLFVLGWLKHNKLIESAAPPSLPPNRSRPPFQVDYFSITHLLE